MEMNVVLLRNSTMDFDSKDGGRVQGTRISFLVGDEVGITSTSMYIGHDSVAYDAACNYEKKAPCLVTLKFSASIGSKGVKWKLSDIRFISQIDKKKLDDLFILPK